MMYHIPVLLNESIDGLNVRPEGIYVDVTFGSGGHSSEILSRLTSGRLFAFDQDPDAFQNAFHDDRFTFIQQNFRYFRNYLKLHRIIEVDGIMADLGISSWQIDRPERGFSTRYQGPLDMRMDQRQETDARKLINEYPEEKLTRVFREFGEIRNALLLSRKIIEKRSREKINDTSSLIEISRQCAVRGKENQYLAQVFQAIRIEINDELEALKEMLKQSGTVVRTGGRIAVISYHSLEDRLVKNYFRSGNFEGRVEKDFHGNPLLLFKPINRKAITPLPEEIKSNPRSRSAKLRIAEKI